MPIYQIKHMGEETMAGNKNSGAPGDKRYWNGKVPRLLRGDVMEKSLKGETGAQIAQWLFDEHNIVIHETAVTTLVRQVKKERKELADLIFCKEVTETVNKDLAIVDKVIDTMYQRAMDTVDDEPMTANAFAKTLLGYLEFRAGLMGTKQDPQSEYHIDKAVIISGLMGKIGQT